MKNTGLNSHVFFKTRFDVALVDDSEKLDLLWLLICYIRKWLTTKYNKQGQHRISNQAIDWSCFKQGGFIRDTVVRPAKPTVFCESLFYLPEKGFDSEVKSAWACKISEWSISKEYPTRVWTTDIGFESLGSDIATISFVVSYTDLTSWYFGEIAPEPFPNVPRIIRNLLTDQRLICYIGSDRLQASPTELKSGDVEEFAKLLESEDRKLPIIYQSPINWDSRTLLHYKENRSQEEVIRWSDEPPIPQWTPILNPDLVFQSVCGNALVFYSLGPEFTREMDLSGILSASALCRHGMVKVYKPVSQKGTTRFLTVDQQLNRILDGDQEYWPRIFRTAFAQGVHFQEQEKLFLYDNCKQLIDKQSFRKKINSAGLFYRAQTQQKEKERIEALERTKAAVATTEQLIETMRVAEEERKRTGEIIEATEAKYNEEVKTRLNLQQQLVDAQTNLNEAEKKAKASFELAEEASTSLSLKTSENESLAAELYETKRKLEVAKSRLSQKGSARSNGGGNIELPTTPFPDTLVDVVRWAEALLPNLIFLKHSYTTAKDLRGRDPQELWKMLSALNNDLFLLAFGGNGHDPDYVQKFNSSHTYKLASERSGTKGDSGIKRDRTAPYNGKPYTFWTHIKDSSGIPAKLTRVYFDFVPEEKKILVFSVGPHEETKGTRKNGH